MAASRTRKKVVPQDRADITSDELAAIVSEGSNKRVKLSPQDAELMAEAINSNAYLGVASHQLRAERKNVKEAAELVLQYLNDIGYPMLQQLAALHVTLEAAMPHLLPPGRQPRGEPYWPAALHVHTYTCFLCLQAGLEAGLSRNSVSIRITKDILKRLGYHSVSESALEAFFQKPEVGPLFRDQMADLQKRI